MGLMDKVKAQAQQLADKAQEQVATGQQKVEEALAKRRNDATLRELGALVYAERSGRGGDDARVEALMAEVRSYEAEHGPISTDPAPPES